MMLSGNSPEPREEAEGVGLKWILPWSHTRFTLSGPHHCWSRSRVSCWKLGLSQGLGFGLFSDAFKSQAVFQSNPIQHHKTDDKLSSVRDAKNDGDEHNWKNGVQAEVWELEMFVWDKLQVDDNKTVLYNNINIVCNYSTCPHSFDMLFLLG